MSDAGVYGLKVRNALRRTGDTMSGDLTINNQAVAAGQTGLILYWNNAGAFVAQRVLVGALNSGGAGFRLLVIPN